MTQPAPYDAPRAKGGDGMNGPRTFTLICGQVMEASHVDDLAPVRVIEVEPVVDLLDRLMGEHDEDHEVFDEAECLLRQLGYVRGVGYVRGAGADVSGANRDQPK